MTESKKDIEEGKFFAVISYISFLCIVSLVLKKDNKFVLFHAKQGLVLFVIEVVSFVISIIPVLGWFLATVGWAIFTVVSLYGIWQSLQGKRYRIPLIAGIADNIVL